MSWTTTSQVKSLPDRGVEVGEGFAENRPLF